MPDSTYHAGTISVAAGGSVVTGTFTAFLSQVKPGDTLIKGNGIAVIDTVLSNTGLALKMPWNGAAMSDEANYLILRTSVGWHSVVEVNTRLTEIIAKIEAGRGFKPDATGTLTDRALNDTAVKGFIFVRTDVVPFELYIKASAASGDWAGPTSVQGDRGEDGGPGLPGAPGADGEDGTDGQDGQDGSAATIEIGSVTTLPPGSAAIVENVGSSGAARLDFGIPAGADGLDGFLPGRRFAFSTTTTDADPGSGVVAFNNATLGSVTTLFIDNEGATGSDVTAWLESFDDSTNTANRGSIFIQHGTDIASFAEFIVTGSVIDGSGYRKVPVTPVGGAGTFTNGAPLVLSFTRTGNKGADGLGAGDIVGPASANDGAIPLFNGTTGKVLKDSGVIPSAFGLSLLDDANQAAGQTTLGLVIGTNVQAFHASLQSLSTITVSAAALTLLDDPNTAAMLTTLGALPVAGGTLTGALTLSGDPSSALHAATKQYVDNVAAGLDVKPSVRLATTTNDTLSGLAARDGVTPVAGNRVLVKAQTSAAQNGIYVAASGAWTRAADMDNWLEVPGANVWVEEGTVNGDTAWVCTSNTGGTLGATAISWSMFGGTGAYQPANPNLSAEAGLTGAADTVSYYTGVGAKALTALTSLGRMLMGAASVSAILTALGVRETLTADRTYYVRTNGSDSNDGLANTSGGAFLTIQKALNVAATLDFGGFTVTIQVADGTYTSPSIIPVTVGQSGTANLVIQGNSTTPANVIVSVTSADCFGTGSGARALIKDMELRTTTGGYCLKANGGGAELQWSNVRFGACAASHVLAGALSAAICAGNYAIVGAAQQHLQASHGGAVEVGNKTITITGTPAFGTAFAVATQGILRAFGNTYSGSATGVRYQALMNGSIQTFGAGATALPGNASGTVATGGQYA